jgi:hypothetical protein
MDGRVQVNKRAAAHKLRTLKWVLPTTLRVYGLRPSGKTKGSIQRGVIQQATKVSIIVNLLIDNF